MKKLVGLAAAAGFGLLSGPAMADSAALGTWVMANGKLTISVSPCGDSLCGTLAALKEPRDKNGNIKLDKNNPDPAKRGRPVVGINIMTVKPSGPDEWRGNIYNADDGHTYSSVMRLDGDTMRVKGCFVVICRNLRFNRVQ